MSSSFFQIVHYLFELHVTGGHKGSVNQVVSGLDQVLRAFRADPIEADTAPFQIQHEIETKAGVIRFLSGASYHRVEINLGKDVRNSDVIFALDALEPEIVNQAIRESPGHFWIHGACLQRGEEIIMLVAESGTGKTTLSLGLIGQGYRLLTDDIILIDLITHRLIPVPRCPKIRPPAPDYLRSAGFDLAREADMLGRYVLLPPARFQSESSSGAIRCVYLLQRKPDTAGSIHQLDITSGILGLLNRSNLMGIDPSLTFAHEIFQNTAFIAMNLEQFHDDLRTISRFL